jgi:hypothetical protein
MVRPFRLAAFIYSIKAPVIAPIEPSSDPIQSAESVLIEPEGDKTLILDSVVDVSHSSPPEKNISTPKSITTALPPVEFPSSVTHPIPALSSAAETGDAAGKPRTRQPSVSNSSVYSPSVYTTHSGMPGGQEENVEGARISGENVTNKHAKDLKFYVGRGTWEERAWLELVRIRESMFWARLGGVRH